VALRDRHLVGAGAAACAVCCAAPVLGTLGLAGAGAAATVATFAFAGAVFALVVGIAALAAVVMRRRAQNRALAAGVPCAPTATGAVDISLSPGPTGADR